jgi:hypothetical protein
VREGIESGNKIVLPGAIALKVSTRTDDGDNSLEAGAIDIYLGKPRCLERGLTLGCKGTVGAPERLYVFVEGDALLVKPAGYQSSKCIVIKHVGHELRRFAIGEVTP